jgi:hypothetical protein
MEFSLVLVAREAQTSDGLGRSKMEVALFVAVIVVAVIYLSSSLTSPHVANGSSSFIHIKCFP